MADADGVRRTDRDHLVRSAFERVANHGTGDGVAHFDNGFGREITPGGFKLHQLGEVYTEESRSVGGEANFCQGRRGHRLPTFASVAE